MIEVHGVTVMKRFWLSFFWCCGWCQA